MENDSSNNRSTGVMLAFFISLLSIILPLLTPWVTYRIEQANQDFQRNILTAASFWSLVTLLLCIVALIVSILIIGDAESVAEGRGKSTLFYLSILQLLSCLLFYMFDYPFYNQYSSLKLGIGFLLSVAAALLLFLVSFTIKE